MKLKTILNLLVVFVSTIAAGKVKLDPGTPVIGIDLGTTYSCVAVSIDGRREVIANDQGNRITPSYVAFTADGIRLIGDAAKNQLTINPKNTIFDIKRLIGKPWNDKTLQDDIKNYPFKVTEFNNKPYIQVQTSPGKTTIFSPEEISAMILSKMKETAEVYLGVNVTHAVITVPAYFNDAQRRATENAAIIAGLKVLRIINEPTAAAIAFGVQENIEARTIVYDLGGGTFDVTLLELDHGVFEVIATNGNAHLGGEDFEVNVIKYLNHMYKKNGGDDILKSQRSLQKLRREVERAKRILSSSQSTRIEIENFMDGRDFQQTLTRAKFEELNDELFKSTLQPVKQVLEDAQYTYKDIHKLVLVGGSTRIPKVRKLIEDYLNMKAVTGVNPDEAVALGAAIDAGALTGQANTEDVLLIDVNPFSLGIETKGGVMSTLIKKNSPIPKYVKKDFTTADDNQESVSIKVFEGERPLTKDNHFLGEFTLEGIPPAPRNVPQIDVTFDVNANGILTVTAVDRATKKQNRITINNDHSRIAPAEMKRMMKTAEQFSEEDKKVKAKLDARNALESLIYYYKNTAINLGSGKLSYDEEILIQESTDKAEEWLKDRPLESVSVYEKKQKELESVIHPIVKKLYDKTDTEGSSFNYTGREEL